jgi:hypothetical protein
MIVKARRSAQSETLQGEVGSVTTRLLYYGERSRLHYGTASEVTPKFVSPSDPAAQWTGALRNAAFFAYANNYLIDVKFGIITDVEASRAIRQAEVGASQTRIARTEALFGIRPKWLAADTNYGSAYRRAVRVLGLDPVPRAAGPIGRVDPL